MARCQAIAGAWRVNVHCWSARQGMSRQPSMLRPSADAAPDSNIANSIKSLDWQGIEAELYARGHALLQKVLPLDTCRSLADLYANSDIFRSRVVMQRHGYGRGEYKYFSYPLPPVVATLRTTFYSR